MTRPQIGLRVAKALSCDTDESKNFPGEPPPPPWVMVLRIGGITEIAWAYGKFLWSRLFSSVSQLSALATLRPIPPTRLSYACPFMDKEGWSNTLFLPSQHLKACLVEGVLCCFWETFDQTMWLHMCIRECGTTPYIAYFNGAFQYWECKKK